MTLWTGFDSHQADKYVYSQAGYAGFNLLDRFDVSALSANRTTCIIVDMLLVRSLVGRAVSMSKDVDSSTFLRSLIAHCRCLSHLLHLFTFLAVGSGQQADYEWATCRCSKYQWRLTLQSCLVLRLWSEEAWRPAHIWTLWNGSNMLWADKLQSQKA